MGIDHNVRSAGTCIKNRLPGILLLYIISSRSIILQRTNPLLVRDAVFSDTANSAGKVVFMCCGFKPVQTSKTKGGPWMTRYSLVERKTLETSIRLELDLDSREKSVISSGVDFFDRMLNSMSRHGRFCMKLSCSGDTQVDDHHTVEDIGICLGMAFREALGGKAGIRRFGHAMIPMDDALAVTVVDLSGRAYFRYTGAPLSGQIKNYSEELTIEFLRSFSDNAGINLHVELKSGDNRHHVHEAIFKSLGVALYSAFSIDAALGGSVPSTKGII